MQAVDTIKRPALRYYGGKWRLAPWVISHFPNHESYVEPCGGAASVLLQKPRSPLETYNDLEGNVVNFFRVLRERPEELIRQIRLTPWAREEYELSLAPCEDEIESARRFFVVHWLGIRQSLNTTKGQLRFKADVAASSPTIFYFDDLWKIAERFLHVQIENAQMEYIVEKYDTPETLFYIDPPYLEETRSSRNVYLEEWATEQHISSSSLLRNIKGYVVLSGYKHPLYSELYEDYGWQRVDNKSQVNGGGERVESVWLNPRTVKALEAERKPKTIQISLF